MAGELKEEIFLGLDYGSKTVGVAVSDPLGLTAQGVEVIFREKEDKLRRTCARIEALIEQYHVTGLVLGYPKNMDNSLGTRAKKTEEFAQLLERRTGLPVILWDERLSTKEAERLIAQAGYHQIDRKKFVDKIAASLILQGFLESRRS